jgi:hypothetical protein
MIPGEAAGKRAILRDSVSAAATGRRSRRLPTGAGIGDSRLESDRGASMDGVALILCEGVFGTGDGKTANGLVRETYLDHPNEPIAPPEIHIRQGKLFSSPDRSRSRAHVTAERRRAYWMLLASIGDSVHAPISIPKSRLRK